MQNNFFSTAFLAIAVTLCMVSCAENKETSTTAVEMNDSMDAKMDNTMAADNMEPGVMVGGANMVPSKNIVENAVNSSDHTTLVAAVKAADLAGTLSGPGPFTVFAPTNEAFNALPAGTVDKLLMPDMKNDLTKVLTYHVVPGKLMAADLKDGQKLKTVEGKDLIVMVKDGMVMINGAHVTTADAVSSNGVTHVVDAVLLPK